MGDCITDDEKKELIHELLLQTPPGEFSSTFNDVRKIVDNDALMKQCAKSYMDYWVEQQTPVDVEGESVCLSGDARQEDGSFLAPDSKKFFTLDPMRKETTVVGDYASTEHEAFRSSVAEKIKEYVKDHYTNGSQSVLVKTNAQNLPELCIAIESHQFVLNNFYTANWRELWNVVVDQASGSAELKGVIKVQVHYYEEGNVQKMSRKQFSSTVSFTSEESLAANITESIHTMTNEYQRCIVRIYDTFQSETFKSLRRALPITHSKINWDQMASYKIGAELKNQ